LAGAFGRLPNSAQQAGFADHRLYRYNGEIIDEATHLGIDLASVQQAPVPAANAGRILKVDYIGIYGNTVIIDHGFGLFSLYSHLSKTLVDPGDMVAKGDIIGHTGTSGWAGGDHLHFQHDRRPCFCQSGGMVGPGMDTKYLRINSIHWHHNRRFRMLLFRMKRSTRGNAQKKV
jgi:murein DD-endopeptidase MepM/ murein hydrolase activator NlpD